MSHSVAGSSVDVSSSNSVASSGDASPTSGSRILNQSTPSSDASTVASVPSVEPQNPFEMSLNDTAVSASGAAEKTNQNTSSPARNGSNPPSPMHAHASHQTTRSHPSPVGTPVSTTPLREPHSPGYHQAQSSPPHATTGVGSLTVPTLSQSDQARSRIQQQLPGHLQTFPSPAQHGVREPVFDDDENTEPSSTNNTTDQQHQEVGHGSSFIRFLENTRKRLSVANKDEDAEDPLEDEEGLDGALIYGYLQKMGRNGKWQTRWFESDGECLSYFKSKKRTKLLATLDLEKVGSICIDPQDPQGCSFTIQVLGRMYHLRANSKAATKDWVITLNRIKEAKMQQGHIHLVNPYEQQPQDLLDNHEEIVAPRVVVVANRERTRAVAETIDFDQLIRVDQNGENRELTYDNSKRRSTIGTVVLGRWTKRRSSLSRLSAKFSKWARSLKKYSCTESGTENVQLDRYVHPPGHDDIPKRRQPDSGPKLAADAESNPVSVSGWIGKETSRSGQAGSGSADVPQPTRAVRSMSQASDDVRMLS
jgi:hypothetical protein